MLDAQSLTDMLIARKKCADILDQGLEARCVSLTPNLSLKNARSFILALVLRNPHTLSGKRLIELPKIVCEKHRANIGN